MAILSRRYNDARVWMDAFLYKVVPPIVVVLIGLFAMLVLCWLVEEVQRGGPFALIFR